MEVKPGYKQTEVGVIPEDWEVACVGNSFEVCNQLRMPISHSQRARMAGPYPYYGPTNVQGWINEYRVDGEYALIGEDGDHFLKWKTQPMTLLVRGKFNVNNHAHLVRGVRNSTTWFYWYFSNREMTEFLTRQGASRYKLTKAALVQIPCALPPVVEQRAISKALTDVDGLLHGLERLIAKKRDLKQAAMQQLLTGQTRLPDFDGEWQVKRLGDEIDDLVSGASVNSVVGDLDGSAMNSAILKTSSLSGGLFKPTEAKVIAPADLHRVKLSPLAETVLISRMNTIELVGECGYVPIDFPNLFIPDRLWMTRFRPKAALNAKWLAFVLCTDSARTMLRNIASGTSGSMKNISKPAFLGLEFDIPPLPEQTTIAEVLSGMDAELTALEARLEKTRNLKQAMMQELLTGRTRLV